MGYIIYRRHIFRFYYNLEACTGALYLVHKFGKSKLCIITVTNIFIYVPIGEPDLISLLFNLLSSQQNKDKF